METTLKNVKFTKGYPKISLKTIYKNKHGKKFNRDDQLLPCDSDELGCESISLDPYGYTCKTSENCILLVMKEYYVQVLKTDNHCYIVSPNTSETKLFPK